MRDDWKKDYYTPQEVKEILGMTYSAIQNQINVGNLHPTTPPGRKHKLYSKKEVDELKQEMDAWLASRNIGKATAPKFVKATIEDMPEAWEVADAVFGGHNTIPLEKRIEWLRKNPDIDYLVKQDEQVMGYFSFIPLKPETIDDLLKQRRFAKELTADDVLPYVPNTPTDIYGMAIGVRPNVSLYQKREYGKALLIGAQNLLRTLGLKGILIRTIQAHSNTPDGIRIMRHMGFTEVQSTIPGMHDFIINVETSGLPFIKKYREALEEWQKAQPPQLETDSNPDSKQQRKNELRKTTVNKPTRKKPVSSTSGMP